MRNKKLFAILTLLCFLFTLMPVVAMADEGKPLGGADTVVATVGDKEYKDLQEAIKEAAPSGTVEIVEDVTVDKWIMFAEKLSIGNGNLITLNINGLTINGNNHTLTVNSIESAGNGNLLFYDAENLNIKDLTITYKEGVSGGIGLQSGTLSNVTFNGGGYGVLPGNGEVTITGCTFATNSTAIYHEEARDNLIVTENTFNQGKDTNVILLRGNTKFTNNKINSGRTVNVVSGSPVVTGNDFGDVRLKVYNDATATIENNEIDVLAFEDDETKVKSTFKNNALSEEAKAALVAVGGENIVSSRPSSSGGGFSGKYNYPVAIGTVNGADVTASKNYAVAGETVTITVTPEIGKQVDEVIVTDADGDIITVSKAGENQYSFTMPEGKVNVAVSVTNADYNDKIILQIGNNNVVVNSKAFWNDVAPQIVGDRTLVPIRVIVEALGGTADWDETTRTVTLTIGNKVLSLVINQPIPGFGTGATIMDNRTYVPVRYVAEYIGAEVHWNAETQQIIILN